MSERSCDRQSLSLTARQRASSFGYHRLIAHRHDADVVVYRRDPCDFDYLGDGDVGFRQREILSKRPAEHERLLEYHSELTSHGSIVETSERHIIVENLSIGRLV